MKLYSNKHILNEDPFRVQFEGEQAIGAGGVCQEMFSTFFHKVYEKYFDSFTFLAPVVTPHCTQYELAWFSLFT